jgi:hypothetical protein
MGSCAASLSVETKELIFAYQYLIAFAAQHTRQHGALAHGCYLLLPAYLSSIAKS